MDAPPAAPGVAMTPQEKLNRAAWESLNEKPLTATEARTEEIISMFVNEYSRRHLHPSFHEKISGIIAAAIREARAGARAEMGNTCIAVIECERVDPSDCAYDDGQDTQLAGIIGQINTLKGPDRVDSDDPLRDIIREARAEAIADAARLCIPSPAFEMTVGATSYEAATASIVRKEISDIRDDILALAEARP